MEEQKAESGVEAKTWRQENSKQKRTKGTKEVNVLDRNSVI